MPFVVAIVSIILLTTARVCLDRALTKKEKMPMKNRTTNNTTEEKAQHTKKQKRSVIRPILETMWWLWLGVSINSLPALEAA